MGSVFTFLHHKINSFKPNSVGLYYRTINRRTIEMLKEQNIGYFEHWWRAMKISGALFVHAFLPDILSDYASKEINNNE